MLAHERRRGDAEPEAWHEHEGLDPQSDLVGGERVLSKPDDHRDPDEEADLERELLRGGGHSNPKDSADCRPVHEGPLPLDADAPPAVDGQPDAEHRSPKVGDRGPDPRPMNPERRESGAANSE